MKKAWSKIKYFLAVGAVAGGLAISGSTLCYCGTPSGTLTQGNDRVTIDYSNTADGYVMVNFTGSTGQKIKVRINGPSATEYLYDIQPGQWNTFSLQDGSGNYSIGVFENVTGTKYQNVLSATIGASVRDEFAPFLCSNQYVNFENAPQAVALAGSLCSGKPTLEKVGAVYDYVVGNISYDQALAASVQSGYVPSLDNVLAKKSGICFDYGSLMAGMLRSQGVPVKLVIGYAGSAYHAWINVWTAESGWINGIVQFDGTKWHRVDPTLAASSGQNETVMQYVGDPNNYVAKGYY